jgi:hypothetical protein
MFCSSQNFVQLLFWQIFDFYSKFGQFFTKNKREEIRESYSDPMGITSSSTAVAERAGTALARAATHRTTQLLGCACPP